MLLMKTRLHPSRQCIRRYVTALTLMACHLGFVLQPASAATIIWTAGSTTDLAWSNGANWDAGEPTGTDDVELPKPIPNPGTLSDPQIITLSNGEVANSLSFFAPYTLTGGTLALTSGQIRVTIGNSSTIESQLTGAGGLLKLNDGALKLTNAANDYTGTTQIDGGSVIVTNQGALGTDASAVIVTGNATRGSGGGSLVIGSGNNNLDALIWTRDLALSGGGASGDGAALNSVGSNTFSGNIVTGGNVAGLNPVGGTAITATATRLASTFGTATLNGGLTVDPSGQSTEFTGNGNWQINSNIDGAGNVIKSGNGLMVLAGNNTFGGVLQLSGGYVRVSSQANLGTSLANNGIFLTNGGRLEIRTDTPDFTTSKRVQINTGTTTGTIYLDREIGGSGLNQNVTLGLFTLAASTSTRTLVIDGRNGYNISFSGNMATGSSGNLTVTNNGNGLFTNSGNFYNTTNTTARTLTFNGNGDFLITGGILASGNSHIVTKAGNGTLTLTGTNATYSGATNIQAGTLAISDFRAITNNTAAINIGNTTTTATLSIVGNNLTGANVTTSKVINLNGTTGGAIILANQTGSSPGVRLNADFTATGGSSSQAKTVTLGGANAQDNTIAGIIPNNAAGGMVNVTKIDSGTWVLAGTNTYTGLTTITNGILKLEANAASSTVLSAANNITFGNNNVNAGGTLEFVGQAGVNNVQALGTLSYANGGAATVKLTPGLLGTASLSFANISTGGGGTVNFIGGDFTNNTITITQVNGAAGSDGILTRSVYWNGADFAYREGGVLRAPVYGVDVGTATSATALSSSTNNEITGSFATNSISISTLKINGSHTLTINAGNTLTMTGVGVLATGGNSVITGDSIAMTGTAAFVVRVDGGADSLRIESAFGGATGGLTKSGAGTLVLAGVNTQTGTVNISEGTVRLSGSGTLGGNNQTTNIRQGATLDLNGVGTGSAIGQFNNNGTVTNTSATNVTLSIGNGITTNGTAGTAFGIIEDGIAGGRTSVSLNTNNNNATQNTTFVFNGLSTYTGSTTLTKTAAGNLILNAPNLGNIGAASSIGAGDATNDATNAASLVFSGAASATQVFATLNYNGSASLSTDRLFTFGGTVAGSGARIRANGVNDATLIWSNFGALVFGTPDIDLGLALGGASIGSNQFNPLIADNGTGVVSLFKQDAGLWILGNSANSYTGITQIDAGVLRGEGTTLPTASAIVFNGGVLQSSGAFSRSLTTTPTAGGGGVNWSGNGGFAAATSKLTVNINNDLSTLTWGTGGFVTGTLILSSSTSFAEVEILNGIDLNAGVRTIQVDTNGTTNSDLATLSGVISGGAGSGLTKTGGGILRLLADNTYAGDTTINNGTIRAVSIGNTTSTASNFGDGAGKIIIGDTTSTATLAYVGDGEITDRLIEISGTADANSTIRASVIESSGTGPLILTNVQFTATGTAAGHRRALYLRGDSNVANEITSVLSDNGPNSILHVTKDDNGTWILSGQNTFTGTTTVSAGPLGISADSIGAVGAVISSPVGVTRLTISNGSLFALDGDRTLNTLVRLNSNASSNFIGVNSITLNNIETTTGGTMTVTNSLPTGKFLTLNSPTFTGTEASTARTFVFNGSGDTILNASVTNSTGGAQISLTYNGYGSLTLGGSNGGSTYTGATTISSGMLKLGSVNAIPNGATASNVTMNPGAGLTATLDLNGFDQTINGLVANSAGTANIDNSSASAATFTFGSQGQDATLIGNVLNSGAGALSLSKIGAGAATFTGGTYAHAGTTSVQDGSILTFGGDVSATTVLSVTGASTLNINGGFSGSAGVTSLAVGGGSTLALNADSLGTPLSNLTSLSLGDTGAGTVTLKLNIGDGQTDTITLLTTGTLNLGNTITFNMSDSGLSASTTYTLLNLVDGGLTAFGTGNLIQGLTPGGFDSMTWFVDNNVVQITTGLLITGDIYWRGLTDLTWNGNANNWSDDKAGTIVSTAIPGQGGDVIFAYNGVGNGALATTLEQNFKVNSLTFEAGTTTPSSVTIASGSDPAFRLQVAPQLDTDGVKITAGGPAAVTISAPFRLGADQTWSVADATSTLTFSGGLQGEQDLTVSGAGKIIISTAAFGTFNPGLTSDIVITGGTVELQDAGALGTLVLGNAANVTVNAGAAFYYNGTAGTVNNPLTLAGGTLSAGAATQTYNGTVTISADSFINMRENNSATLSATARNITLSGQLSGGGRLTVDSVDTLTAGNPETGTLTLSGDNSGWSGGIDLQRGTITVSNFNGLGTGDIAVSAGRIILAMTANNTVNLAQNITVDAAGGVFELEVNASGTLSGDLTINLNGVITLGSAGNANMALRLNQNTDNFSVLNITNSIVLGNDASISYAGSTVRPMEIAAVISETGGARALTINDDLGGWGQTNPTVRLSGANTFTGAVNLASGVLEFGTVTNIAGAASNLGQGGAINLSGGVLSFIGGSSQSTDRAITTTASATLDANGTGGATITYSGAITQALDNALTLTGSGEGFLTGGITQTGTAADINVNSGIWHIGGATSTLADDIIVTATSTGTAVLHLDATGVLSYNTGTSNGLYARDGGVIHLNADDVNGVANSGGLDFILLGDTPSNSQPGTLHTNGFNITTPRLDLGGLLPGRTGVITGNGTITGTYTGTDYAQGFRLFAGTIAANLAGGTTILKQSLDPVTLSGDNSGLTGSVNAATRIDSGTLILDYTISNATKLNTVRAVDLRGGTIQIVGNNSAATSQNFASLTLGSGGSSEIQVTGGTGQEAVLNLGAITRANAAADGTMRFILPSGVQSATNGITTTSPNSTSGLLGNGSTSTNDSAYATVDDGTGVWFAANNGSGNIVARTSIVKNDVTSWLAGDHVTDDTTGFTGTILGGTINSLRLNAAAGSDVILANGGVLTIASGGILITSNVGNSPSIQGGILVSGANEIVITQDSAATFEISSNIGGSHALTKTGAGTLLLTGVNFYTDETEIQEGTLQVNGTSIGDTSPVNLADDHVATLQLLASEAIGRLTGGSNAAGLDELATVDIGAHTLTINSSVGNATYAGKLVGSGVLVKNNSGANTNQNFTGVSTGFNGTVIINGGLLQLSNVGAMNATDYIINSGGSLLIDNNGSTSSGTRILDTATITLNSADGAWAGETKPSGLTIRRDQNSTQNETVGVITARSGASYARLDATATGSSTNTQLIANDIVRQNNATLDVRGTNLGNASGRRTQFKIGDAANQTAFIGTLVGAGGASGTTNQSIVTWAIAEFVTNAAVGDGNMGNSLATYVSGQGFRALDFSTEYTTIAGAGASDNARESLGADLTGIAGKTINSLVIDNAAFVGLDVTGSGAGQTLANASGTFLFTVTGGVDSTAYDTTLGGFDDGITTGTGEYVFFVQNPSSVAATATLTASISSMLTSMADITKSGRGTLVLSGVNTAGGGANTTTLNEGVLEITDLDNIGGNTGGLVFAGGTLRLGAGLTDDISTRTITLLNGGGTIDTNGIDLVLANSIGNGGGGGLTKTGLGSLTLAAGADYLGNTIIGNGTLIVNSGVIMPSSGSLTIGSGTDSGVVQLGDSGAGSVAWTVSALSTAGTGTANAIVGGGADASILTVDQNTVTTYAGSFGGVGANENNLGITKSGVGILTLSGDTLSFTGPIVVNAGTLEFTGSASAALATSGVTVAAGATLNLINGAGQAVNLGSGTLDLGTSGIGATVLGLELGSTSAYDSLATTGTASSAGSVLFNLTGLSGFGAGNYDLLTAGGGLSGAAYSIGSLSGSLAGFTLSLTPGDTLVQLGSAASTGSFYWQGAFNFSWLGNSGLNTNFTTDLAGTMNANGTPGIASSVIFSTSTLTAATLDTTLDAVFSIQDLTFNNAVGSGPLVSISIAAGTGGTLTITPVSSAAGIHVETGAPASITLSAPIILGADQTWTVADASTELVSSGGITGTADLIKAGDGILTLGGTNVYDGDTTVNGGVLQALTSNDFNPNSLHTIGGSGILRLNNSSQIIGSLAGSGIVENSGSGTDTLTTGGDNTSTIFSGILQDGASGLLGLTKAGTGMMTLSGSSSTMTGVVSVTGGILKITGTFNNGVGTTTIGSSAGTVGALYVAAGASYSSTTITLGGNATGAGVLVVDGGDVMTTTGTTSAGIVMGDPGYGGIFLNSGSITTHRIEMNDANVNSASVIRVNGGTLTGDEFMIFRNQHFEFTINGGLVDHTPASNNIALGYQNGGTGVLNVTGGILDNTGRSITIRENNGTPNVSINLNGGQTITNSITKNNAAGTGVLNFNGGTLTPGSDGSTLVSNGNGLQTYVNGSFGFGANVFAGGVVIDTAGLNTTISAALIAPTGSGVDASTLSFAPGSGYIGAPVLEFSGDGTGATGYVVVDLDPASGTYGQITGVVLTNPGVNYTTAPTVTLIGGGGTGGSVTVGGITANSSGGLVKNGPGTLTLSGANTYTGGTTINLGTLALGANNVLEDTGSVTINGGVLDVNTRTETVGVVSLQGGGITGSTGILTSTADYDLQSGTVGFTGTGGLAGLINITKTTGGTVTLTDNGFGTTFGNVVNVNGGVLEFSTSGQLGDASGTNTIGIDGGTLSYISPLALDLTANRVVMVGSGGATLDTTFAAGVLQLTGGITTSGAGNLTKTGSGTVVVAGTTNLNGGNVTVSAGTLNAGFSASGISGITVAAGGTLNLYDGSAVTAAITALSLADGSSLGFDLNGSGVNDVLALTGAPTLAGTITLNFNDLGSLGGGTYDLITSTGAGLNGATYVLGTAPSGLNYAFDATVSGNTILRLTTSPLALRYWQGDQDTSWSTNNAGNTNWATDAAGTTELGTLPAATDTLVFSTTNNTQGPAISTTLDGVFTADSLQFISAPSGVTSFTVAAGSGGALTLTPFSANNGIAVGDNAGDVIISALLTTGAVQSWEVAGTGANGSSLTISGDVTFTNAVTKTGDGELTLSGTNTGTGGLTILGGTLNLASATALGDAGGTLTIGPGITLNNTSGGALTLANDNPLTVNGSFTFTGTNSLNFGAGTVTLGNNIVVNALLNNLTFGGAIGDGGSAFALTKAGAGTLILNGDNTYDGLTSLLQGTLTLAGDNSAAGGGVSMEASTTLRLASATALGTGVLTINGGTLDNSFGGALTLSTNNLQNWNGSFTLGGTDDLNLGTGAVTLGADITVSVNGTRTLTVGGVIDDGASTFNLLKSQTGSLVLSGVNTYKGDTTIAAGTLIYTANQSQLSLTNRLLLGNTAGDADIIALDLTAASAHFGGAMIVQTNNATTTAALITIGNGQTLQVDGAVTIGYNVTSAPARPTLLTITGATMGDGTFSIGDASTPTNSNVQIGNGATSNISNPTTVDMSGLGTFYANLGTGIFRVGDTSNSGGGAGTGGGGSTLILAPNSTIFAATITSDSPTDNVTQAIKLGAGTNEFNANTITIGISSNRTDGTLDFLTGTGSLKVRALNGTSRATMNVASGSSTSSAVGTATVDLTGHSADLLLGTLTIGGRAPTSGTVTGQSNGVFRFDTGTLDATTVVVGTRTGAFISTGSVTGELNLMQGGGSGVVTITTLNMAVNSGSHASTNGQAKATLNIGGSGTLTITTLTMVNNSIGGGATNQTNAPADSTVNISGSMTTVNTLNMNTNSSANTGTGNASLSTLNISGGVLNVGTGSGTALNMANASNAAATATSTIVITGGTLNMNGNLAYTNGAGTENTTLTLNGGTLDMGGFSIGTLAQAVGSGSGSLNFQSGTLQNVGQINGGATLDKTTAGTLILDGVNAYTGNTTVSEGTLQLGSGTTTGSMNVSGSISVASGATFAVNQTDTVAQGTDFSGVAITGAGNFEQAGTGTTILNVSNTYTGSTTVSAGTLQLGDGGSNGALDTGSAISVAGGATFAINQNDVVTQGTDFSAAAITGAGSFAQTGAGVTILTAANTYSGATNITGGTLQVGDGATGSLDGAGTVTVSNAGSKLSGSGSITGSTIIGSGALLAPGVGDTDASNQTLTFTAVTIESGGQVQLSISDRTEQLAAGDLNALAAALTNGSYTTVADLFTSGELDAYKTTAPGDHDFVSISGSFSVNADGATPLFKVLNRTGAAYTTGTPAVGDVFNLMDWTGLLNFTGTNTTLTAANFDFTAAGFAGEFAFDTSAFATHGILVVVPEPSRALFLMLGLVGLLLRRRK